MRGPSIDLSSGATMRFEFGLPSGAGFGTGAKLQDERLFVEAGEQDSAAEEPGEPSARAALDPGCTFETAVKAFLASGADTTSPMTVAYYFSAQHRRPVWSAQSGEGPARFADGHSCALLVR